MDGWLVGLDGWLVGSVGLLGWVGLGWVGKYACIRCNIIFASWQLQIYPRYRL